MDHLNREHTTKVRPIQRNSSLFTLRYSLEKVTKKEKREKIRTKKRREQKEKATLRATFSFWWGMVDSNHRRRCQQIYSLSPLATREIPHMKLELVDGFEPPTC